MTTEERLDRMEVAVGKLLKYHLLVHRVNEKRAAKEIAVRNQQFEEAAGLRREEARLIQLLDANKVIVDDLVKEFFLQEAQNIIDADN